MKRFEIITGDVLHGLTQIPDESVQLAWTSPPYWGLRDYGVAGQIGFESTPDEYVEVLVRVFREVRRVLKPDGTLWLNLGDCYVVNRCGGGDIELHEEYADECRRRLGERLPLGGA